MRIPHSHVTFNYDWFVFGYKLRCKTKSSSKLADVDTLNCVPYIHFCKGVCAISHNGCICVPVWACVFVCALYMCTLYMW